MDTRSAQVRLVSHQEFRQALRQAGHGLAAAVAYRYDARRGETVWTVNGQPIGLTVGRVGSTSACYVAALPSTDPFSIGASNG